MSGSNPSKLTIEIPDQVSIVTSTTATAAVSGLVRVGYWAWGTVLVLLLAFVGSILWAAADCTDPAKSTKDVIAFSGCSVFVQQWYIVLRDWQTGIGAAIGLLGVAWSTFFNSATGRGG